MVAIKILVSTSFFVGMGWLANQFGVFLREAREGKYDTALEFLGLK